MSIYANDNEQSACDWMAELPLKIDHIDNRSITDVRPSDLDGFTQCHFFAGIGGWPYALELAGWPRDFPVWTGSCPCQPFSAAGKRKAFDDERNLWPAFRWLIAQCRPPAIFGEQVESAGGREWLSRVCADLEAMGYRAAGADLCAAGVGAPHIRQRLFWGAVLPGFATEWMANGGSKRWEGRELEPAGPERPTAERGGSAGRLGDTEREGPLPGPLRGVRGSEAGGGCGVEREAAQPRRIRHVNRSGSRGFWATADYLYCQDNKWRPVCPQSFPLIMAPGVSAELADGTRISKEEMSRVTALRGLGNAIVPQLAAEFIRSFVSASGEDVSK